MRVLILGGTSSLGMELAANLSSLNFDVSVTFRKPEKVSGTILATLAVKLVPIGEVKLLKGFDVIINCLAVNPKLYDAIGQEKADYGNYKLPVKFFDQALYDGVPLILNCGSYFDKIYSEGPLGRYADCKRRLSAWGVKHASTDLSFFDMRLEHVFGPLDSDVKFVPRLLKDYISNVPSISLSECRQTLDFIHVDDVVSAFRFIMTNFGSIGSGYHLVGVGRGVPVPLRDFVELAHRVCNSQTILNYNVLPVSTIPILNSVADTQFLTGAGWLPRVSLEAGIRNVVSHLRASIKS